jgi:threonine/homoserine/homoserine lactone efflux protein
MDVLNFAATVIIITVSGALAPGPLFFVTISHGMKTGAKSGIIFSIAHTIVEFSLVILLAFGLLTVSNEPIVRILVGVTGGAILVIFGAFQIKSSILSNPKSEDSVNRGTRRLLILGLALTGLNPYFIIWWLTIGANLIFVSLELAGLIGVLLMYVCHVWVDYVWLILLSKLAKRGNEILNHKWYRLLMIAFGIILIYFGFTFLIDSLNL